MENGAFAQRSKCSIFHIFKNMIFQRRQKVLLWNKIYILRVVALDETNIPGYLHFSMQNIEMSCDLDVNVSQ